MAQGVSGITSTGGHKCHMDQERCHLGWLMSGNLISLSIHRNKSNCCSFSQVKCISSGGSWTGWSHLSGAFSLRKRSCHRTEAQAAGVGVPAGPGWHRAQGHRCWPFSLEPHIRMARNLRLLVNPMSSWSFWTQVMSGSH